VGEHRNYDILKDEERQRTEAAQRHAPGYDELNPQPAAAQPEADPQRPEERRRAEQARAADAADAKRTEKPKFNSLKDKYDYLDTQKQASVAERLSSGRVTPGEASDEMYRFRNQQDVKFQSEVIDFERNSASDREFDAAALENAKVLTRQSEEMRQVGTRLESLGHNPLDPKQESFSQNPSHEEIRYQKALGEHFSERDPYGSLGRVAGAEYSAFAREQQELANKIAHEYDATARHELQLKKEIRAADHLAFTSNRISDQFESIYETRNSEEGIKYETRAKEQEARSEALNEEYKNLHAHEAWASEDKDERASYQHSLDSARQSEADSPQKTGADAVSDKASGANGEMSDTKREKLDKIQANYEASSNDWREAANETTKPGRGAAD
jgi:hypothetical protein